MENNSKECFKCKNYIRYYSKGIKQFNKTKYGWCKVLKENTSIHDYCESYTLKPVSRKKCIFLKCYLSDLLTEITGIRNLIEENENEIEEIE